MAHLLLSLVFLGIMAVAMKSIAHDLMRPLVMRPWEDGDWLVVPQAAPRAASVGTPVGASPARPARVYATQPMGALPA